MTAQQRDTVFRCGAFALAVVPLGLVVFVVVRSVVPGVIALVVGMIAGTAMVFAEPEPEPPRVPRLPTHAQRLPPAPDPYDPVNLPPPGHRPVNGGAGGGHPEPFSGGGHVLGTGSNAGRAPWFLPVRSGQPGIAVDAARVGDLEVRAASVIGPAHRCEDPAVARQDAYQLTRDSRAAHLVVAVADGLSNSAQSELAARVAVSTAARELAAELDRWGDPGRVDAKALFTRVAGEITGTGRGRGVPDRDLCCLLVVAAVPTAAEPDGSRRVWTAQIGDVSVWTHGPAWCQRTGVAKSGFDRNTVSAVLPFHPDQVVATTVEVPPGHGVGVLTDGVGDLMSDVVEAPAFFGDRWATPPHPAAFLAELCVDAPGQDDDRTAVVIWCGPQGRARR